MHHEALLYSTNRDITKKNIQHVENIIYDQKKYTKLKERVQQENIEAIIYSECHIRKPIKPQPYILYYIGDINLLSKHILGIVGPRNMSNYAERVLRELFTYTHEYDLATISGMADGVDMLCHKLSIAQGIPTIAVVGGGLGWYFKRSEWKVIQDIVAAGGLVLSECRLEDPPAYYTFPQRNRIIAGLSDVLFLPEAGKKSGSLITVDYALTMKTPVFAVPNSIFSSHSEGILQLMESGYVKPIVDFKRFLHQHFPSKNILSIPNRLSTLSDEEKKVISFLSYNESITLSGLVNSTGNDIDEIIQVLTKLEMKGLVTQERPGEYVLV